MNKLMIGSLLGGLVLVSSILFISNTPSYPSIPASTEAVRLMTEHMKMHDMIDRNMNSQHSMISRIITILENILKVKERKLND